MAKPASKTKKTIQAKLGSLAKAGTTGKKRSASSQKIALPISNKQKKSQGSSIDATNLAAATHDNNTDSIVDQDVHVVLTWMMFPIIPFYLWKNNKVKFLTMMKTTMMTAVTTAIILE